MQITTLESATVRLIPLHISHVEDLFNCSRSEEIWEHFITKVSTIEDMRQFVLGALLKKESGEQFPFTVIDKKTNQVVGMTRFLRIDESNKTLNIGWTWYAKPYWNTYVNSECKLLMLTYAFEEWKAARVEFITTPQHVRSQRAIARLGATREGLLRKKYYNRDYVVYSIIDDEWPAIKAKQLERINLYLNN